MNKKYKQHPACFDSDQWASRRKAISRSLLKWYHSTARDLPWRRSPDPYRVWVSEIMLQQTQVERVKDYFQRFVTKFPTVFDLAGADEAVVLRYWEGLGYYRRARQLHAAAKLIVSDYKGIFPQDACALRQLPGVGRYTAGAIASISFDLPEPILEANSRRVLARFIHYDTPLSGNKDDQPLWDVAAAIVPRDGGAGAFNQALMDLGSIICTPVSPRCEECPLADHCEAYQLGSVDRIPNAPARKSSKKIKEKAYVFIHKGKLLVVRRQPGEWWEGLWDFPRGIPNQVEARGRQRDLGTIDYSVTNHKVTCQILSTFVSQRPAARRHQRWLSPQEIQKLPMTSPGRRIVVLAEKHFSREG
jgi:A/G-specific adenine glycosylase